MPFKKGQVSYRKGKHLSEETKRKLSIKAKLRWKSGIYTELSRYKMGSASRNKIRSLNHRENIKKSWLKRKEKLLGKKKLSSRGYVFIYQYAHPFRDQDGYVSEHRLVMEMSIKRYLKPEEVVHHKNGIKTDNRIENLQLFATHNLHMKIVHKEVYGNFFI